MKKKLPLAILIAASMSFHLSFAQPGLKNIQQSQNEVNPAATLPFTIAISPTNSNLGSVLFAPTANIQLAGAKQWLTDLLKLRHGVDELRKRVMLPDASDMQVERFDQYYKGIRVEHGVVNAAGKGGLLSLLQMEFYSVPDNFITTHAITAEAALETAMKYTGSKNFAWQQEQGDYSTLQKPGGELVIIRDYLHTGDSVCLAYKFLIIGEQPVVNAYVYVNATTGLVTLVNSNIREAVQPAFGATSKKAAPFIPKPPLAAAKNDAPENHPWHLLAFTNSLGTANTLYSGMQNIYTDQATHLLPPFATYFRLAQSVNGFNIETKDSSAHGDWIENDTNAWTSAGIDDTATEAHFDLQVIAEYWKKKFGRNSYDNDNADVIAYVHTGDTTNAHWAPDKMTMNFGDGDPIKKIGPSVGLDITSHEFGHAISSSKDMPGFVYKRESGSLDEGFSDIWAACVEKYGIDSFSMPIGKKPWLLAEESNPGKPDRDFINPKNKNMADTYYGAFYNDASIRGCPVANQQTNDLCYVHANSSILLKWFSLITIGGSGTNDHNYNYNVAGLGFGTSDSIAYNTEKLLSPNTDYHAVMNTSINYTSWKYGVSSNQLAQVMAAWRAVGLLDTVAFNNTTNQVFGTNNSFTCVAVGKGGHVWAGTSGKGLYQYNGVDWAKYNNALQDSITVNKVSYRDIKSDKKGGIWIGQSGYVGINGTSNANGGIYFFEDTVFSSKRHYSSSPIAYKRNVISRAVTSIFVDTSRNNARAALKGKVLPQVWVASVAQTNSGVVSGEVVGIPSAGGVAMGLTDTITNSVNNTPYDSNFIKVATPYLTNVDNRATLRGSQTIGGDSREVWVYSDANNEKSLLSWGFGPDYYNGSPQQIMRYDAGTGDSLGVFNSNNTSLISSNFIAKAIYFDKHGNKWLGLLNFPPLNNAIIVMDSAGNWHSSSSVMQPAGSSPALPDIFPPGTSVNNNAIAGDGEGKVYVGTNNGLIVYTKDSTATSAGSLEDYKCYRRYTVNDGLPSNIIRGLAIDTIRHGVWLATDNGIVLWRLKGPERMVSVSKINIDNCKFEREITYTINIKGKYYNTPVNNQLITELSDAKGDFSNPTILETETWYQPIFENDPTGFDEPKTTNLPFTVPDGDNYLIRVRATNPAFIGALSAPFAIRKPTAIIPALGAVSHSADRECLDANNWTNYYYSNSTPDDPSDDILLLSIWKGNSYIGTVGDGTFDVTVASTPGAGSNFGVNVSNAFINNPFVSMNRFWKVTPTIQPANNVVVRFYYNSQDLQDVNGSIAYGPIDHTKLVFYKTNGNPDPTSNLVGLTTPPTSYTNDVVLDLVNLNKWVYKELSPTMHRAEFIVTGFSGGSGGSTPNAGPLSTLPLKLLSFEVRSSGRESLLQWQTSAEINTAYFEIERSEDGSNFNQVIGKVMAAGNSSVLKTYSFTDPSPVIGKNYYRLKMVDIDGKTTYSLVKFIHFNKDGAQVVLYPNPSNDVLNIKNNLSGKRIVVTVSDVAGRRLLQVTKANARLLQISIAGLSAGSYILQLSDGATVINNKVEKK